MASVMEHNRLGLMGHYYGGMLDIYSDLTKQCAWFGGHVEILEVDELAALRRGVPPRRSRRAWRSFERHSMCRPIAQRPELERAARTSVALDRLVDKHRLGSLAYYYLGAGNPENEDTISSIILGNSLLTARGHSRGRRNGSEERPGHEDHGHFGAGGSFTEYYAMDYNDDVVLMGHDGPGHIAIAEGKTKVRPLRGVSRQGWERTFGRDVCQAWSGDVAFRRGDWRRQSKLLAAEGESVAGPIT